MKKVRKARKTSSADTAQRLGARGKAISRFFTKTETRPEPFHQVEVTFTSTMLDELDAVALDLNINRESLIKTLVRQALDQHYLARSARQKVESVTPPFV